MKKFFTLFCFVLITASAIGQTSFRKRSSLEFGLMIGASHYMGELTKPSLETRALNPAIGILTKYNPIDRITFRLQATYGTLTGDDRWYPDDLRRNARNAHFKSKLWDFYGGLSINLNTLDWKQDKGVIPYVFGGVSIFKFNPQAQFTYDPNSPHLNREQNNYASLESRDGEWVDLQPLGTEGQETTLFNERKRYSLTQIAIPFGMGLKFQLGKHWNVGIEYGWRMTFTDYIDDVSTTYISASLVEAQYGAMEGAMSDPGPALNAEDTILEGPPRGNPNTNDWYGIMGVTLTYRIDLNRVKCFQF